MITGAAGTGLAQVAETPAAGTPLINGTQTLLSWTAPNDGQLHTVIVAGQINITGAETGGQITFNVTGAAPLTAVALQNGGHAAGQAALTACAFVVGPGATVNVNQNTALTAGAATFFGSLWAA
jgi:hypothetical protein